MIPVLKVQKLIKDAVLPKRMTDKAAAYDIAIPKNHTFWPREFTLVHTGLALSIPEGYHIEVHIRSSWGKRLIRLANCTGIVDNDYKGELLLYVFNDGDRTFEASKGTRIAQIMLVKDNPFTIEEVDDVGETSRGKFSGSTGDK